MNVSDTGWIHGGLITLMVLVNILHQCEQQGASLSCEIHHHLSL